MEIRLIRGEEVKYINFIESPAKKLYVEPQLLVYGSLSKITQSGTGSVGDGSGGGKQPKKNVNNPNNSSNPKKKR